ncbi:predicted protein [Nematostella vectensis]|uniref:Uncharacterized protein n=1 Tax=Nematostella vectensis TaxID=45351 RepID=A7SBR0_NEMVE|nr:predicted protein [Nematostella vectensis]|eukprot:XP_001630877.1 predicted protein [Nematostella vectensis]
MTQVRELLEANWRKALLAGVIGDVTKADELKGNTVFESVKTRPGDKRKREGRGDPGDIEGYQGPWAPFVDESKSAKPSEEEASKLEEFENTKQKRTKKDEEKSAEEKTTLHVKDAVDYQGRSYLHIPKDLDVKLDTNEPPERCYLPKKHIHTWYIFKFRILFFGGSTNIIFDKKMPVCNFKH